MTVAQSEADPENEDPLSQCHSVIPLEIISFRKQQNLICSMAKKKKKRSAVVKLMQIRNQNCVDPGMTHGRHQDLFVLGFVAFVICFSDLTRNPDSPGTGEQAGSISDQYLIFPVFFPLLTDNAYDPDVSAKQFWIDKTAVKDQDCLIFMDNGNGMDYDKMHKMLR